MLAGKSDRWKTILNDYKSILIKSNFEIKKY